MSDIPTGDVQQLAWEKHAADLAATRDRADEVEKLRVDMDNLPRKQYLLLEVLAARHRLGEDWWTFPVRFAAPLRDLQAIGVISVMHGITEGTLQASLTDAGRACALADDYVSPLAEAHKPPEGWESVADLEKAYRQTLAEMERSEAACASAMAELESLRAALAIYEGGRDPDSANLREAAQHAVQLFDRGNQMGLHAAIPALRQALNEGDHS